MTQSVTTKSASYAEYLAEERASQQKHEFLRGEVWAMAGGTPEHGRLAARVIGALLRLCEDKPCEVFSSDVRVRVPATDLATYPDASVVCGPMEVADDDEDAIVNPLLIAEVLSPSTEGYDRGQKWAHYQRLPSLRAYLLIAQDEPRAELFTKEPDGSWRYTQAGPGQSLRIEVLDGALVVDELFRKTGAALN